MNESFPKWLLAMYIIVIVVIFASSLSSLAFLYCYRNTPIVAMGQPSMLAMICFGILIVAVSLIFQLIVPSSTTPWSTFCSLDAWFNYIGYNTILTTMLCMLYRVHKVMRIRRNQTIRPRHVLGPFVAAQLAAFAVLIWYEVEFSPTITIDGGIEYCYYDRAENPWIYIVVKDSFYILLFIVVLLFAWKLRHVNEEIGCSRKVFLLCCFSVIMEAIFLAIFFWTYHAKSIDYTKKKHAYFVANVVSAFIFTMATICFLILPRMYYVWYERIHGHLPESLTMIGTGRVHVNTRTSTAPTASTKSALPISGNRQDEDERVEADAKSEAAEA